MAELDDRKLRVLAAIVEQFIETGEPIGSKRIAQIAGLDVSPATIRNDMAVLFDMGLLEQPHTSAGRIPSHLGYRVYVDRLMNCEPLTPEERREIDALFNVRNPDPERLLEDAAKALAEQTRCATITTTMTSKTARVKKVDLVAVAEHTLLVLVMASNGVVKSKIIRVDFQVTSAVCNFFTSFANGRLAGRSLSDISTWYINSLVVSLGEYSSVFVPLLSGIYELCREIYTGQYHTGGSINLLDYQELDRMMASLLQLIHRRDDMLQIVSGTGEGISVLIGKENPNEELSGSSVVVARYRLGSENMGAIAVIGPVRMDYSKLIPHLDYFSQTLGQLLADTLDQQ